MSFLPAKDRCTGCSACYAVCPRGAISMRPDSEGFLYPVISNDFCIKCGLCEKVCPSINQACARKPLAVYAAMAKDDAIRAKSSSGGIFSLLANETLKRDGAVYGAAFDHDDWHVYHREVDNEKDLEDLRGSKYVQSDMGDVFKQVKTALVLGRAVLFSGTPCQISGLRLYLSASNVAPDNLMLVDVVCHAVPSPLVWRKYLEKRASAIYTERVGRLRDIRRISSRRKNCGWKRFSLSLGFADGKEYLKVFSDDPFMRGFLVELFNRLSCHNCPCKNLRSGSDITIADFWGVAAQLPEMDDDKGTSLVMVNTEKGARVFALLGESVKIRNADFDHAIAGNSAVIRPTIPHRNRNRFFWRVVKSDFDSLVNQMLLPPLKSRIRAFVGRNLRRLGLLK